MLPPLVCNLRLFFQEEVLSFAKTLFIMDRTENDYSAFEKAMDEQRLYRQIPDFTGICLRIGADPAALDAVIYDELGYRGQDLVDYYRRCENIH